jgi:hypothetical protein
MGQTTLIYSSENGDRWLLVQGFGADRAFVRHEANLASGGHVTETEVGEFLAQGRSGPEHAALRRMLGEPGTRDAAGHPGPPSQGPDP